MDGPSRRIVQLAAFASIVVAIGCAAAPTAPVEAVKTDLNLDGVPCDSTVVTDGTCRGGYIIPWS